MPIKENTKTKIIFSPKSVVKKELFLPDSVISPHANPVRNGPVLPHLLGKLLLDHE